MAEQFLEACGDNLPEPAGERIIDVLAHADRVIDIALRVQKIDRRAALGRSQCPSCFEVPFRHAQHEVGIADHFRAERHGGAAVLDAHVLEGLNRFGRGRRLGV